MCILSIVSSAAETILTFNRDEDPDRPFSAPVTLSENGVFCPLDLASGGTWIGRNHTHIMCLQNGALQKHKRDLPYDKSRGLILLELLKGTDAAQVFDVLKHFKIEPFTITMLEIESKRIQLYVYNGKSIIMEQIPAGSVFFRCSSTLYSPAAAGTLDKAFRARHLADADHLWQFHLEMRIGGPANTFLSRPATSSITQFVIGSDKVSCKFADLISQQTSLIQ
jgi:Transport and Golgi organisation 2